MTSNDNSKNIFLMPCWTAKTKEHLDKTVLRPVKRSTVSSVVPKETSAELEAIFGRNNMAVWGSIDGRNNRTFFNKMRSGDYILFSVGQQVKLVGQIALKTIRPELSKILWPGDDGQIYGLIYFIDNVVEVNTPLSKVFAALGYKENYMMRGLTTVSSDRLRAFYSKYQDIVSLVADA